MLDRMALGAPSSILPSHKEGMAATSAALGREAQCPQGTLHCSASATQRQSRAALTRKVSSGLTHDPNRSAGCLLAAGSAEREVILDMRQLLLKLAPRVVQLEVRDLVRRHGERMGRLSKTKVD